MRACTSVMLRCQSLVTHTRALRCCMHAVHAVRPLAQSTAVQSCTDRKARATASG